MFKKLVPLFCFIQVSLVFAQSNSITSSPYSLFGLGTQSNSEIGKFTGLGNTGLAVKSRGYINLANPASLANFNPNLFLFDLGVTTEISTFSDDESNESRYNANLTNIAIAFPLMKKAGMGLSLTRSSSVGYSLSGIEASIENTASYSSTDVTGFGGINDIRFDFGYQVHEKLSLGFKISYLWGEIEEEELIVTGSEGILLEDVNLYGGFQLGFGFQFQASEKILIGGVVDFQSSLKGTQNQFVSQIYQNVSTTLSSSDQEDIPSFDYPLAIGSGISYLPNKKWMFTLDYKYFLWDQTEQQDSIGTFVDQTIFGAGAEFTPKENSLKYYDRINYRAGLNYDSGYLEIENTKISNLSGSLGFGLPIGNNKGMLNFSYTKNLRGFVNDIIVNENVDQFHISLSLFDIWFKKRKFN